MQGYFGGTNASRRTAAELDELATHRLVVIEKWEVCFYTT